MSFFNQISDRLNKAYYKTPIILGEDPGLEEALSKAYIALFVYNEPCRTELILDGLHQRFGYSSFAP